jgi:uncharacterized protein involved in high-affinity Fe2+ transport
MFKMISAALLAVSVLAAPAMATGFAHKAPATKSIVFNGKHVGASVLNAQARMKKHHVRHHRHHIVKKVHVRRGHRH